MTDGHLAPRYWDAPQPPHPRLFWRVLLQRDAALPSAEPGPSLRALPLTLRPFTDSRAGQGRGAQILEGYGPDNPPPTKDGIGPDPNAYEAPPEDNTPELTPRDFHEVPLDAEDRCIAEKHADRVREEFGGKGTTSAAVLRGTLMKLGYPESRIHAMPAQGGSPRVRLDLRIDSQAALEIVGTSSTLVIQPFGAVAAENLKITDVKR
ncbi:hypothetical protein [Streptomyces sp. NPDC093600]|uniref:hypothetical protein n=1 Tax=Streptomyces sp. NPDC093600 TaxID=3366047 RepID=UPI00380A090C